MKTPDQLSLTFGYVRKELRRHAPFTLAGTLSGIVVMVGVVLLKVPPHMKENLFWTFHPLHVFLSAMVTVSMCRYYGRRKLWPVLLVGYFGSIGIATLSDCIIPFIGEALLRLPNRGLHLGVIEKWWLVNPMALAGIGVAWYRPYTRFPHAGHVLLSTWASLFHMQMALSYPPALLTVVAVGTFLFFAVWIPCCTSDIVFPLMAIGSSGDGKENAATDPPVQ